MTAARTLTPLPPRRTPFRPGVVLGLAAVGAVWAAVSLSALWAGLTYAALVLSVAWSSGYAWGRGTPGITRAAALGFAATAAGLLSWWMPAAVTWLALDAAPSLDPAVATASALAAFVVLLLAAYEGATTERAHRSRNPR